MMLASAGRTTGRGADGATLTHASLITAALLPLDRVAPVESAPPIEPGDDRTTVTRQAAGGALWSLLAFALGKALGFGTNIALARLLAPADFGLVSFAMILIGAFLLLQDLGVGAALVYLRADMKKVAGTALTINLAASVLFSAATALIAAIVAAKSDADASAAISAVLSLGLVLTAAGSVQTALLTKDLAFRRKFLPDVAPLLVSGLASIVLALLGCGVWSLVWGYLAKSASGTILLWSLTPVRPRPRFELPVVRELLRYGRHVSLSSVIGFAVLNVDYFIVGHRLGAASLGLYTLAFMIAILPSTLIGQQIATATFPAYARLRHQPQALTKLFADTFTLTSALAIALGVAIIIGMPSLVGPLLGAKWLAIVGPLRILAVFGILRAIEFTFSPLYRSIGRPEIMWMSSALRLLILAPLLLWGVGGGIERVAIIQVAVGAVFIPLNGAILARLLGLDLGLFRRLLLPQLASLAALGAVVAAAYQLPAFRVMVGQIPGATALVLLAVAAQVATLAALNPALVALGRARCGVVLGRYRGATV